MRKNLSWHKNNPLPKKSLLKDKIQWYVNHERECACHPTPKYIQAKLSERKPKVVVGVLVRRKNKYLLVEERMENDQNYWIIPGGKVEFGESLTDAANREIKEETGLTIHNLKFISFKEAIFPKYNYHTVIFFYLAETNKFKTEDDIEGKVIQAKWYSKEEIKKLKLVNSAEWFFANYKKSI